MSNRTTCVAPPDYRALFEAAPDLYLVLTPEFEIVTASNAYLQATKTERANVVGRSIFDVFPDNPDDPQTEGVRNLRASLTHVRLNGATDAMPVQKYDILRPESEGGGFEERFWSPVNSPVFDASGRLAYIIHRVEDVTEYVRLKREGSAQRQSPPSPNENAERVEPDVLLRSLQAADASRQLKEANREIREREQILRSILDNTSAVVYLKDLTGKLLMANHQFCSSFLNEGEVATGKTFYDIFVTDTADLLSQYDRRVLETKSSFQVEELLPMNDGPHLYLTSRFVIRDDSGEVTMLGAVSTDITELRTVKSQVDRFFELSNNLLCIANMDGYFVRANEAWERTLGIKLSDLTSRPFTDFIHPDDLEPTQVEYARQAAGQDVISFENRYRCADGSYRTLLWNATPTTLDGLIYASAHDITERKSTELQIAGLNLELSDRAVQLEAVNRELEAFCYSVSHDLRAPLRAIDGFSLALIEDCAGKLAESELGYLKRVRAGAQRMAVLIDDLLRLSRVSRSSLNIEEVDLSKLAETVIERIRERDAGRVVEVTIAPHLSVHGDRQLLSVLLENLLGNAWKFTGKTNQPAIRFDHTIIDGVGRFCVRDNGAGFDMMYVHKLFSAFQRLHTEKEFEGTGIGLATAQRVVRRHGGDIWAESGVSQGAAFYFTLQPSQRHGGNHAEEINPAG